MYVVKISRTGIGNAAGEYRFDLLRQHRFKIIGKDADCSVIKQQRKAIFNLPRRDNIPGSHIHVQGYADRRVVRFQGNTGARIIVTLADV